MNVIHAYEAADTAAAHAVATAKAAGIAPSLLPGIAQRAFDRVWRELVGH